LLRRTIIAAGVATAWLALLVGSASAELGFPVGGLKPDTWGTTPSYARSQLLSKYHGIRQVTCLGVRMKERPLSASTWVVKGVRYWDKLWCQGTLRSGKVFRLVYDATGKTSWKIYRLVNVTVPELRSAGTQPERPSVGDALVRAARELAIARGGGAEGDATHRALRYSVQDCGLVNPATGRCTLFVLYETDVTDSQFRPGHMRYWVRYFTFARLISVDPVAWDTRIEGAYYDRPWQIVCSDRNEPGRIVVDWDPLTGTAAPPCP
jgi:hypothetical protein